MPVMSGGWGPGVADLRNCACDMVQGNRYGWVGGRSGFQMEWNERGGLEGKRGECELEDERDERDERCKVEGVRGKSEGAQGKSEGARGKL